MPVMNGTHFIKSFRKIDNSTPVIALTSNGMLDDKIEMFEL
jgi:DNA-binding response OmpR family regulator